MRRVPSRMAGRNDVEAALAALDANALRDLVRDTLCHLDEPDGGRVVGSIIERAARASRGFVPTPVAAAQVEETLAFARAARREAYADPVEMDKHLRRGSNAFLGKDYAAAGQLFGALLKPIAEGDIDLGQDELPDEVLGVDLNDCQAQYLVSAYMTSAPQKRAEAVRAAIEAVNASVTEPLHEMERVAVEPLSELEEFLPKWRAIVEAETRGRPRAGNWYRVPEQWLSEVVRRLEGAEGLAALARSTKQVEDLRTWCRALVEEKDWTAVLAASEEAAELAAGDEHVVGEFLDGAALAAKELGRHDLPAKLERAWRKAPTFARLRRWLGSAADLAGIEALATQALAGCREDANRQRGLLDVIRGDFEAAAKLLAAAPGLGWSGAEHPGHLLFQAFQAVLEGDAASLSAASLDLDDLDLMLDPETPRLPAVAVAELLARAGVKAVSDPARQSMLEAMCKAAEHRVAGVTEKKRRTQYGHAAALVAACVAADGSSDATRWAAALRERYRRFPALRAELDRAFARSSVGGGGGQER